MAVISRVGWSEVKTVGSVPTTKKTLTQQHRGIRCSSVSPIVLLLFATPTLCLASWHPQVSKGSPSIAVLSFMRFSAALSY